MFCSRNIKETVNSTHSTLYRTRMLQIFFWSIHPTLEMSHFVPNYKSLLAVPQYPQMSQNRVLSIPSMITSNSCFPILLPINRPLEPKKVHLIPCWSVGLGVAPSLSRPKCQWSHHPPAIIENNIRKLATESPRPFYFRHEGRLSAPCRRLFSINRPRRGCFPSDFIVSGRLLSPVGPLYPFPMSGPRQTVHLPSVNQFPLLLPSNPYKIYRDLRVDDPLFINCSLSRPSLFIHSCLII